MMVSTFARDTDDEIIEIKSDKSGVSTELSIKYRPYLYEFLDDVSQRFELVLYSTFNYYSVHAIANAIEKSKKYFSYRFHDEFCLFSNIASGVKCIDFLLGHRSNKDIIVVDTKSQTLPLSVNNFLPIEPFAEDGTDDKELIKLSRVLEEFADTKDVTAVIGGFNAKALA